MSTIWIDTKNDDYLLLISIIINNKTQNNGLKDIVITNKNKNKELLELKNLSYDRLLHFTYKPIYNFIDKTNYYIKHLNWWYDKHHSLLENNTLSSDLLVDNKIETILCFNSFSNLWLFTNNINWKNSIVIQPFQPVDKLEMTIKVTDDYLQGIDKITFIEFNRFLNKQNKILNLICGNYNNHDLLELIKTSNNCENIQKIIDLLTLVEDKEVSNRMFWSINALAWSYDQAKVLHKQKYCVYHNKKGLFLQVPDKIPNKLVVHFPKVLVIIPTKDLILDALKMLL